MITLTDYWMGRDSKYRLEFREVYQRDAASLVERINKLLGMFFEETKIVRDEVVSGWRPATVNDNTCNASTGSTHITGNGCDIRDADRKFAAWCVLNTDKLAACSLWMEDPRWTPTWVHLQQIPPKSGKRIYIPSTKPALASALPGQRATPLTVKV